MFGNQSGGDLAPLGHPIRTLMEEHKILQNAGNQLANLARKLKSLDTFAAAAAEMGELQRLVQLFKDAPNHYFREENVIFPQLEKKGLEGPPAVMWNEHDQIRGIEKNLYQLMDQMEALPWRDFSGPLERYANQLAQTLMNHFFKENNILFPHAIEMFSEAEWQDAKREFQRIGYCSFTPMEGIEVVGAAKAATTDSGKLQFTTGTLTIEQLEAIFHTLPAEITFIDHDDQLRFFSHGKDVIFPRSTAALGLKVQNCHPQKSVHLVNQILEDFKSGRKEVADFWINLQGRLVYIRYFPVRDEQGNYLGCMEVTQDVSQIKKLEGEKRL